MFRKVPASLPVQNINIAHQVSHPGDALFMRALSSRKAGASSLYCVMRRCSQAASSAVHSMMEENQNPCGSLEIGEPLVKAALRVLYEPNAARKCELTYNTAEMWRAGKLTLSHQSERLPPVPDRPSRDNTVSLSPPLSATKPYMQLFKLQL